MSYKCCLYDVRKFYLLTRNRSQDNYLGVQPFWASQPRFLGVSQAFHPDLLPPHFQDHKETKLLTRFTYFFDAPMQNGVLKRVWELNLDLCFRIIKKPVVTYFVLELDIQK